MLRRTRLGVTPVALVGWKTTTLPFLLYRATPSELKNRLASVLANAHVKHEPQSEVKPRVNIILNEIALRRVWAE
jgi:hypothetical protein